MERADALRLHVTAQHSWGIRHHVHFKNLLLKVKPFEPTALCRYSEKPTQELAHLMVNNPCVQLKLGSCIRYSLQALPKAVFVQRHQKFTITLNIT